MSHQQQPITPMSDLVFANVNGQKLASVFLSTVQGRFADPDTLYDEIKTLLPEIASLETLSTLRGYCRGLQKELERGHP